MYFSQRYLSFVGWAFCPRGLLGKSKTSQHRGTETQRGLNKTRQRGDP